MLIHTMPDHTSTRHSRSRRSSGCMDVGSNESSMNTNAEDPSRFHRHPWNGQTILPTRQPATALRQLRRPMAARIVQRLHRTVLLAHDQDGVPHDLVLDEVARIGDLLQPRRHLPRVGPEMLLLQLEELPRVVPLLGYLDRRRHGERDLGLKLRRVRARCELIVGELG